MDNAAINVKASNVVIFLRMSCVFCVFNQPWLPDIGDVGNRWGLCSEVKLNLCPKSEAEVSEKRSALRDCVLTSAVGSFCRIPTAVWFFVPFRFFVRTFVTLPTSRLVHFPWKLNWTALCNLHYWFLRHIRRKGVIHCRWGVFTAAGREGHWSL